MDGAGQAIYQCDHEGRCTYVNAKLCELFDITREAALETGWLAKVHPDDRARVIAGRQKAISPAKTFQLRYRIVVRGEIKWVEAFSTALMKDGAFVGRTGIIVETGRVRTSQTTA